MIIVVKRLADGSEVEVTTRGTYLALSLVDRVFDSAYAYLADREEAIAVANLILAAVREQDEARAAVAAPDAEVNALIDGPCAFEEGA